MSGLGMGFLTMGLSPSRAPPPQPKQPVSPGDILVVIHDFNARSSDELTLRKSEKVELIELDDGFGDGWYLGRHLTRGGTGLFPGVYTTRAPSARPPAPPLRQRSSYGSPPANFANSTPLSPIPPSPASYQQSHSPTETPSRSMSQYSPAFTYESHRTSLPASYNQQGPLVQRSISQALGDDNINEDSPVMEQTLSVIEEHITDLSTPRQSLAPVRTVHEDVESDFGGHIEQQPYVAGPETDDEENGRPTESEVRRWDQRQVAQHLRILGVDPRHCDIFEEQEISGEVLLEMDKEFIYMKEYDFGVMGRRLKTWHKVRDFQTEVKGNKVASSRQSTLASVASGSSVEELKPPGRMLSNSALLPRIPSLSDKPGLNIRQSQQQATPVEPRNTRPLSPTIQTNIGRSSLPTQTPPSPWRASMAGDSPSRPSAAMVRELTHSRRHSSIDFGRPPDLQLSAPTLVPSSTHQKHPSLDREWSMSQATAATAAGVTASPTTSSSVRNLNTPDTTVSPPIVTNLDPEMDRGYFSGNELDNRKQRGLLRKRDSGAASAQHSRQSSANNAAMKRHSRLASLDSVRELGAQAISPASRAYHGMSRSRLRSSSNKSPALKSLSSGGSPTVTNLEEAASPPTRAFSAEAQKLSMQEKARKLMGFKGAPGIDVPNEKVPATTDSAQDSSRPSPVASPTGSTTPSGTSRSLEYENSETASRVSDNIVGLAALPKAQARTRPKGKQETSAYQRGLLKISPEEARKNCDHHGWMKKKSSTLLTTWKPRLFILRGRRLSYYYAESDTEERGIIDISGHKVLVANSDAIITLHAQITGATSAASPNVNPSSTEPSPNLTKSPETSSGSPFYFKLVPPKSGMSRAVQFTKPTIHFFQVDSLEEGRKWMGEIMKATIEHDLASFETSNKQKTISLAKARANKERPPALKETIGSETIAEENKENMGESGLNIQGLNMQESQASLELVDTKEVAELEAKAETETKDGENPPGAGAPVTSEST